VCSWEWRNFHISLTQLTRRIRFFLSFYTLFFYTSSSSSSSSSSFSFESLNLCETERLFWGAASKAAVKKSNEHTKAHQKEEKKINEFIKEQQISILFYESVHLKVLYTDGTSFFRFFFFFIFIVWKIRRQRGIKN
jgi:hypothetical protein